MQNALSIEAIKGCLGEMPVYLYREIDSTNNEAKRRIAAGEEGAALIVAEGQTAGRGRQGKSFYSPAGTGIYMTLSLPVELAFADAVAATTAAAVAVFSAIRAETGLITEIKWVNDLYYGGKKISGILAEAITDPATATVRHVIIGVGLNVSTEAFPEELQGIAASLPIGELDRNRMIGAIARSLMDTLHADRAETMALYRRHSMVLGKEITYLENGRSVAACAVDIDENGGLIVEHEDGSRATLQSGEISLRLR